MTKKKKPAPVGTEDAPKNPPDLDEAQRAFRRFCETIAKLRDPETGCPWDLEQDHASLRPFMIEEAYEAATAMATGESQALRDELGDVLLQVVLNSQVGSDEGDFSIVDVIQGIDAKMRRRHPHVFGTAEERADRSMESIKRRWYEIKREERRNAGRPEEEEEKAGYFDAAHDKQPATLQAHKIGKLAARIQFDWDHPREVFGQVVSEIREVEQEISHGEAETEQGRAKVLEEVGDVFFTLSQLCRHLGADPETVSLDANRKFLRRFEQVERLAQERGVSVESASRETLETLWQDAKKKE